MNNTFSFWQFKKEPPMVLQSEQSECGLACLAMIAKFHGHDVNMVGLRQKYSVSAQGSKLSDIIQFARELDFVGRPLRLELEALKNLKTPCILHWDLNHFVVLVQVKNNQVIINDPATGRRVLIFSEVSKHFTGVALELTKSHEFQPLEFKKTFKLSQLFHNIRGVKVNLLSLVLVALVIEVLSLLNPFFMQWSIDKVIPFNDENLLIVLIVGFAIVFVLNTFLSFCREWIAIYFTNNLRIQVETNIFAILINRSLDYFSKRHVGDIDSRFRSVNNIQSVLTTQFITAILDGFFAILTLLMMFMYSVKLTILVLTVVSLDVIFRWIFYKKLKELSQEALIFQAKKNSYFLETIRGVQAVQFFNKESQRTSLWLNAFTKEINVNLKIAKMNTAFTSVNMVLFGIENLIFMWIGITSILQGVFTIGVFIAFKSYKDQFKTKANSLIKNVIDFQLLSVDKERLSDIILTDDTQNKQLLDMHKIQDNSVELVDVAFRYSDNTPFVFENININIASNEFVAIVGKSGKGKTTLMNLIAGLKKPTSGDILIGKTSIINAKLPNNLISMVSQSDTLYAGSIAENICFFDENVDLQWVTQCAMMASIHDEVMQMTMGYETLVGDMGTVLSGGQKQRLLIARALYFKPKILLLDEATSHLDVNNEQQINHILKQIPITRIIIAHRMETINSADRVIEL